MYFVLALFVLFAVLSATGYRVKGSDLAHKAHGGRLLKLFIGALPVAVAFAIVTGALSWVTLVVLAGTMAADSTGHGESMDLGRVAGPYWRDALKHALSGVLSAAAVAAGLAWCFDPVVGVAALALGALKWPTYELGWLLPIRITKYVEQGTELGEFLYGASRVLFVLLLV